MDHRKFFSLLTLALLFLGCREANEGTGPGKRPQVLALRTSEELAIGRQALKEILRDVRFSDSGPEIDRVREISGRIAEAIQIESLQREINLQIANYEFEWEYVLVEDNRVNAFCLPGGKIVVFSGLLDFVRNDDQLATVIAHEIAHAVAHHTSERIAHQQAVGNPLLNLAFSREQESEADHIGIFLMTFAGYDPDQALAFWEGMNRSQHAGIRLPEIISDHPSDVHRMMNIKKWASDAKAGKVAFDTGRIAPP